MSDAKIGVTIEASLGNLTREFALAKAEAAGLQRDMNALAKQNVAAGGGVTLEQVQALDKAALASATAQAGVRKLAAEMREAGEAAGGLSLATAGATRELIVLPHELLQGRFSRIPGSLMVLAERMGGLGSAVAAITPSMYGAAAAAVVFAAGLAETAISAFKSEEALQIANRAFQLVGLGEGRAQIAQWTDAVRSLPGVSAEAAGKIVAAWAKVHDATPQLITAVLKQLPALGSDADEIARQNDRLAESFNDLGGAGAKFLESLNPAVKTMEDFRNAAAQGDRAGAMGILLAQLAQNAGRVTDALGRSAIAARGFGESFMLGLAGAAGGVEQLEQLSDDLDAGKIKDVAESVRAALAAPTTMPVGAASTSEIEAQGERLRDDVTKTNTQILAAQVSIWQKNLDIAKAAGESTLSYERGLNSARAALARAGSEQAVSVARESASALEANDKLTRVEQLAAEAGVWRDLLAGDTLTADERINVARTLNETLASLDRARTEQSKTNAEAQVKTLAQEFEKQMEIARKGAELAKSWNDAAVRFNEESAKQSSKAWEEGFSAIDGAAKEMLSDVLTRHASLGTAATAAVQKLALAWTEALAEIMLKLAAFEALRAASGIGGFIGGLAGQGAAALGGQAGVPPSQNALGGVTPGTEATGLAAVLPQMLARMLGVGGGAAMAGQAGGAAQQLLVNGVTKLTSTLASNTTSVAGDTAGLLANTTGVTSNTTGLLSSIVQGAEWVAGALGLTTATSASALAQSASVIAINANTAALIANTISNMSPAAMAGAGMIPMATGAFNILGTQPALLHAGEMVLPAAAAEALRGLMTQTSWHVPNLPVPAFAGAANGGEIAPSAAFGGNASGAGSGGTASVSFNNQMIDGRSFQQFINNPSTLRMITQAIQRGMNNNPSI